MADTTPTHPAVRLLTWIAWVALITLLVAVSIRRIWEVDFWWQCATGRHVWQHGIPSVDVFSYSVVGAPWIELRWLYCLLLYGVTEAMGFTGPIFIKAAIVAASLLLVTTAVLPPRRPAIAAMALAVAVLACSDRIMVRPELATWIMVALFVAVIHRWRVRRGRVIWAMPVLQLVWVNTHTLFILGPLLVGLGATVTTLEALVPRMQRSADVLPATIRDVTTMACATLLTAAACLANPYGFTGAMFPLQLAAEIHSTVFKSLIGEFRSPFGFGGGSHALVWYKVLIGLTALSILANIRRLDLFWTLLVLSQFYLSFTAVRNIPLFALAAVPCIIENFSRAAESAMWTRRDAARNTILAVASVATFVVSAWYAWQFATNRWSASRNEINQFGLGLTAHRFPFRAIDFIEQHNIPGPVLNTMLEGACLIERGHKVLFDPRLEVYGEEFIHRQLQLVEEPRHVQDIVAQFGIRSALLDIQSRLVNFLLDDPEWSLVYFDESAAVFVRAGEQPDVPRLDSAQAIQSQLDTLRTSLPELSGAPTPGIFNRIVSPMPYIRVADLLLALKQPDLAMPFLHDARAAWPDAKGVSHRFAIAWEAMGESDKALAAWLQAVNEAPDDVDALVRLAQLQMKLGRMREAAIALEKAVHVAPDFAAAWALLASAQADMQQFAEARASLQHAIDLEPHVLDHRRNVARVAIRARDFAGAEAQLLALLQIHPGDPSILQDLAIAAAGLGALQRALDYAERGLTIEPGNAELSAIRDAILQQISITTTPAAPNP